MKDTREIVAAVLTLVAAQTNRPLQQVMADYETTLRAVYDLSNQLRDRLEHASRRSQRPDLPPIPDVPGGGAGGRP